ncbi:hypothetical protein [Rhizobium sp. BK176]|uniref:hypothetical protein n=1 Tax=Rhizobium sp. BK176 TaxID=2587071 RepID=UPI002167DF88|nr:hypothetical protein [Rhizobium sp. BK176]MCS4088509.1 hypothetical protein [Rhizobium sp. BK176]
MRFELPFAYNVEATTSRWKTQKTVAKIGFVGWVIPEVSSAQAPLAMEWEHVVVDGYAHDRGEVYRREVRFMDGKFYTPFGTMGRSADYTRAFPVEELPTQENNRHTALRHFQDFDRYESDDPRAKAIEEWYFGGDTTSKLDGQNDVTIVRSEEQDERAYAEEVAARFLIIDGAVYIAVAEPRLVARAWRLPFPGVSIEIELAPHERLDGAPSEILRARPDEHDKIEDFVVASGAPLQRVEARNPIVHLPQAFEFNSVHELATRTAYYARTATRPYLDTIGRDAANAWYDLHEAITIFESDHNVGMLEEAMSQVIPVLLERVQAAGLDWTSKLEASVDLWASSEITLDIGTTIGNLGMKR